MRYGAPGGRRGLGHVEFRSAGKLEVVATIIAGSIAARLGVPDDGNPHRWRSLDPVTKIADTITADYAKADPVDASHFQCAAHRNR